MNEKIIVIAGPTAVGKTEYAIGIARSLGTEIVSCDSMQLYRYMDIGSAKPTPEERAGVRHHLVDIIDPREEFSVVRYRELADEAIADISSRGMIPVICGGTGLYLDALLYDLDYGGDSGSDPGLRRSLYELAEREGPQELHKRLEKADPAAAGRIHPNNVKRTVRALEAALTGNGLRDYSGLTGRHMRREAVMAGLSRPRAELYERIGRRVDMMLEAGLADEVRKLMEMGLTPDDTAMKGIGYKELIPYLNGEYDLGTARELIKKNTRHLAKRQMTWFRRYSTMEWFDAGESNDSGSVLREITGWLQKKI